MLISKPSSGPNSSGSKEGTAPHAGRPFRPAVRTVFKCLCLLLVLILLNGALSFVLEPFHGPSEEMWQGFRQKAQLDTVYTGTSQCLQGIDPEVLDPVLHQNSYNMATNMQSLADSYDAIETAIREKHIQRAILVIDHEVLDMKRSDNFRADQSYWHAKAMTEPSLAKRLSDDAAFMTSASFFGTPASLTYLTPWVYSRTTSLAQNLKEKLSGRVLNSEGHRTSSGFLPSSETLDPSLSFISWEEAEEWDDIAVSLQELSISEENKKELAAIRDLCAASGVSLTVMVIPYPNALSIYRVEEYLAADQELSDLFGEAGFDFYDFNRILPEYFDASGNEYYSDVGHMNAKGAERFSAFLAEFLAARENKEDVRSWFRSNQ